MKRINKILSRCLLAAALLGGASCHDLEEYNPSGATADAVWSTPEGFMTLVNAAYSDQRQWYGKEDGLFLGETGTDLWINQDLAGYARQITKYEGLTPADGNPMRKGWLILWQPLNHVNAGIERIDGAGFVSEEEKNRRLGELRFLRAFYYWHLVETYGGVMLRTEETKGVNLTAERSPVEDFYELMIEDLKFAEEHLPIDQGAEYSRASKKSAMGMLARVYLSRAYYGDGNTYFQLARDKAAEIINRQAELKVKLWDNYADLFDPKNNDNRTSMNKEALYVVSNSSQNISLSFDHKANQMHMWFLMQYSQKPGLRLSLKYGNDNQRRLMPTRALLDFYDEEKDARYHASFREVYLANQDKPYTWTAEKVAEYRKDESLIGTTIEPGDTAYYVTKKKIPNQSMLPYVVVDRDSTYYSTTGAVKEGRNFVTLTKFQDPVTREDPAQVNGYLDFMVIRLAEIYLIAAEAEFQLGNLQKAAEYLNVIRERAALPGKEAEMRITAADVDLDFILDERARELAGEHLRWFDLKRTGKLVERVNKYNPDITEIKSHHVLRPVPQTEIDALLNGKEFGNNPGY